MKKSCIKKIRVSGGYIRFNILSDAEKLAGFAGAARALADSLEGRKNGPWPTKADRARKNLSGYLAVGRVRKPLGRIFPAFHSLRNFGVSLSRC